MRCWRRCGYDTVGDVGGDVEDDVRDIPEAADVEIFAMSLLVMQLMLLTMYD